MQIITASKADKGKWDAFVKKHPEGSPFDLFAWHDAVVNTFGHKPLYYIAAKDGNITGILPLFQLKSILFGNIISSIPFAAYGGILADFDESFQLLLQKAKDITRDCGADYLELTEPMESAGAAAATVPAVAQDTLSSPVRPYSSLTGSGAPWRGVEQALRTLDSLFADSTSTAERRR